MQVPGLLDQQTRGYLRTGLRRHLLYLLALIGLFVVCREGQEWSVVIAVLVVYVAMATLTVRGQYVGWLEDGDVQAPSYLTLWILLVVGFVCVGLGVAGSAAGSAAQAWFLFPGVITTYLAAGLLLTRARAQESAATQWRLGLGATAVFGAMTVAALGTFALVEDLPRWLAAVLALGLATGLFVAPTGTALLAERAVELFDQRWSTGRGTVLGVLVAGALLSVAAAAGAAWWYDMPLLFVALLVFAGLAIAIVSGTLADVFAVLGVIALMGVTPQQEPVPAALDPGAGQRVLVAFGDSYMSGEGADTYYAGTDDAGRNQCRRAPTAWAVQAAQRYFDGLVFLACSGARTYNVRHDEPGAQTPEPRRQAGEPGTQLDQYDDELATAGFDPELVVISIGGNDAGFSTIGKACAVPGSCDTTEMKGWFTDELPQVERELRSTFQQVRATFPDTPVAVTAYPDPIHLAEGATRPCDALALSAGDVRFIKDFLGRLNAGVKAAAEANGLAFVAQTEQALARAGVQLCDPVNASRPGVNFVGLRSVSGLADQRFNPLNWIHNSFHPNERGHAALLRAFDTWWAETGSRLTGPGAATGDTVGGVALRPQCDLVGDGLAMEKCRSNADRWAVHQLAQAALPLLVVVLLVAVPAWFAAAALFGWRRHVRRGAVSP